MEFNPHHFMHIKLGLHVAQFALIFVGWIIEITVFTSSAKIDGRPGWFFALVCFARLSLTVFTQTGGLSSYCTSGKR